MSLLEAKGLYVSYGSLEVLHGVSFHVNEGEAVALLGPNGCGKSTIINTVAGIVPPTKGEIWFRGQLLNTVSAEQRVHRGLTLIPERRQLFDSLSVMDNLELGSYTRRRRDNKREIEQDRQEVFKLLPILWERRKQVAGLLSGGEAQMVAIGRGLMAKPKMLILDEPSLGLSPLVMGEVMRVLGQLRDQGYTILLVEQNVRSALRIADRGYVMETGNIILEGTPAELQANELVKAAYLGR